MKNALIILSVFAVLISTGCKKELVDTGANDITDIDDLGTFKSEIATGVSVVFFHASWCSICAEQRPHVEAASKNEEVKFARVIEIEYDDNKPIFTDFNVDGFPQLLIFKEGTEQTRLKGKGHDEAKLVSLIKQYQ